MAGLSRALILASAGLLAVLALPAVGMAADPAPGATPRPPTCTERYPADGPAGVDLRLGCIVSEVMGLWQPGQASPPPPLSTYALAVAALTGAGIGLGLLALRLLARRAGDRLAPVMPDAWWVCGSCHSVNGAAATRCYNCGAARPEGADAAVMVTSDDPATPQSFGRGKHEG